MRLIHFSDLHFWTTAGWDGDFTFKRVLGRLNLRLRRGRAFPPNLAHQVVAEIVRRSADLVVFSGDISTTSMIAEFRAGREALAAVRDKWGERFVAIPGNHDRYTRRACRQKLFEKHFLERPASYPFAGQVTPQVGLVGIDLSGARIWSARGTVTRPAIEEIGDAIAAQKRRTPFVIVVGHYPLALQAGVTPRWGRALPLRAQLLRQVADAGANLYLHGHEHRRRAVLPYGREGLVCVDAGSAGLRSDQPERAAGFVQIDVEADRVSSVQAAALCRHQGQSVLHEWPLL